MSLFNDPKDEFNDLNDHSLDYTERTFDEHADGYSCTKLGRKKKSLTQFIKVMGVASAGTMTMTVTVGGIIATPEETPEEKLTVVNVYFDLTEIGLYNGEAGYSIPEYNLTYGYKVTMNVGDPLPKGDVITSSTKQTFKEWLFYEEGSSTPVSYTEVAEVDNRVYVASFNDDAPTTHRVTFTGIPSLLKSGDYDYYSWNWGGKENVWMPLTYNKSTNTMEGEVPLDSVGINLCALYKGSTEGDWTNKYNDNISRIYFQSKDIDHSSDIESFDASEWLFFPNDYPVRTDEKMVYVKNVPSYIYNGNYTYLVWAFGGTSRSGEWLQANFINSSTMILNIPAGATGFCLCAVYKGSRYGNWDYSEDGNGRIYYVSGDLSIKSSSIEYSSPGWRTY